MIAQEGQPTTSDRWCRSIRLAQRARHLSVTKVSPLPATVTQGSPVAEGDGRCVVLGWILRDDLTRGGVDGERSFPRRNDCDDCYCPSGDEPTYLTWSTFRGAPLPGFAGTPPSAWRDVLGGEVDVTVVGARRRGECGFPPIGLGHESWEAGACPLLWGPDHHEVHPAVVSLLGWGSRRARR